MNIPEDFPHAPAGWSPEIGLETAREEGVKFGADHWIVILALQEFFSRHDDRKRMNRRALHDALNEKFHQKGGLGYLYQLLPQGPIAQGCRLAGLQAPEGSVDLSYGSTS
jgi:tRNA 2-thiouridine synthesizing protein E